VIVGPDGAPWITDGGLNAIVRVDPATEKVSVYPLPSGREGANLNTAVFDKRGVLWFTGQSGIYGRLDPKVGQVEVFDAPKGSGPYGIAATPELRDFLGKQGIPWEGFQAARKPVQRPITVRRRLSL